MLFMNTWVEGDLFHSKLIMYNFCEAITNQVVVV